MLPNILIITTDQQRKDSLSLYGQPGYRTPHLDALAAEGVCFDRAYTPSPVCTPARVSMITGQHATRHGAYQIGCPAVPALEGPLLGTVARDAGYATGLIGKTHFVSRSQEEQHIAGLPLDAAPPDEAFWENFEGPYLGFDFLRHSGRHNIDGPPDAHYRRWLNQKGQNLDNLHRRKGDKEHNEKLPAEGRWEIDPELTQNAWIAEESAAWIEAQQKDGRPWLCMANFQDPHSPFVCPDPYYSAVDMSGVDLGEAHPDFSDRPGFYDFFSKHHSWQDDVDGKHLSFWDGINLAGAYHYDRVKDPAQAVRAYIGMVNMVDHYVGRLIAKLRDLDCERDTLVIFTSDHGEMLGQRGFWWKGLPPFEANQQVPFLMRWPALQEQSADAPQGRLPAFGNLVDILPTVCEAINAPIPLGVQGVSQLPVLRGETESVLDHALVDFVACDTPPGKDPENFATLHQQTLVHGDYKLIVYRHCPEEGELYNLADDPEQCANLWQTEVKLRERLVWKLLQANMRNTGCLPQRVGPA